MSGETVADRVKIVRDELRLSQKAIAELLGLSLRSWNGLEAGRNIPSGETLLKFVAAGYNPGWVLTGNGSPKINDIASNERHLPEAKVIKKLARIVMRVHTEAGVKLLPEDVAAEATELYNELSSRVQNLSDMEEIEAVFPQLELHLKRRLADAVAEQGSGKEKAS